MEIFFIFEDKLNSESVWNLSNLHFKQMLNDTLPSPESFQKRYTIADFSYMLNEHDSATQQSCAWMCF